MTDKIKVFTLRIDKRSKDIVLSALSDLQSRIESAVAEGTEDQGTLQAYDEVTQLRRGIALAPGEEMEVGEPEPTDTPKEEPGDPSLYHSQQHRPE